MLALVNRNIYIFKILSNFNYGTQPFKSYNNWGTLKLNPIEIKNILRLHFVSMVCNARSLAHAITLFREQTDVIFS